MQFPNDWTGAKACWEGEEEAEAEAAVRYWERELAQDMNDDMCDDDEYWYNRYPLAGSGRREDYIELLYYTMKFNIPTFITLPASRADDEAELRRIVQERYLTPESSADLRRLIGRRPFTARLLQNGSARELYRHVCECHAREWSSLLQTGEVPEELASLLASKIGARDVGSNGKLAGRIMYAEIVESDAVKWLHAIQNLAVKRAEDAAKVQESIARLQKRMAKKRLRKKRLAEEERWAAERSAEYEAKAKARAERKDAREKEKAEKGWWTCDKCGCRCHIEPTAACRRCPTIRP